MKEPKVNTRHSHKLHRWIVILAKIVGITICLGVLLLALQFFNIFRMLGFGMFGAMDRAYNAQQEGNLDAAMYWANVAVKRSGHVRASPYALRGRIHEARGDLREAIEDYTQAISNSGWGTGTSFIERGRAHENLGNLDAAVKDYSHAILADPTSKFSPQSCAELRAERNGPDTLDEMIEVFDRAIAANPDNDSFHKARAILKAAWRTPIRSDR